MAKTKITIQEAYELRRFVQKLDSRRLYTPELRSALIILRQYCDKFSALKEWGDSVAHRKRNKEITFQRGVDLWVGKFLIDTYFSKDVPQLKKIPIPIFEKLLTLLEDPNLNLNFGWVDTQSRFPGGYSIEEIVASIKFMYHKSPKENVYKLLSGENADDLELMQHFIAKLKTSKWTDGYFHFDEVRDDIASMLEKLIGADRKVIQKNEPYLAAHFLAAFHLTEIDLKDCDRSTKKRCFLSLGADAELGGYLSLNLGLYHKNNGVWEIVKLKNFSSRLFLQLIYWNQNTIQKMIGLKMPSRNPSKLNLFGTVSLGLCRLNKLEILFCIHFNRVICGQTK